MHILLRIFFLLMTLAGILNARTEAAEYNAFDGKYMVLGVANDQATDTEFKVCGTTCATTRSKLELWFRMKPSNTFCASLTVDQKTFKHYIFHVDINRFKGGKKPGVRLSGDFKDPHRQLAAGVYEEGEAKVDDNAWFCESLP